MQAYFAERDEEVVYIPNGVEPPQPTPMNELRQFIPEGRGFLLWMGRFVPEKRVEDLIHADVADIVLRIAALLTT